MFNIVSESMEPTFYKDDLVVVKKCNGKATRVLTLPYKKWNGYSKSPTYKDGG